MSRSSCLGVQLETESTIDAAMGLTIVQVDVHLWVPESATATITTNLGKQTASVKGLAFLISFHLFSYVLVLTKCQYSLGVLVDVYKVMLTMRVATILMGTSWIKSTAH